MAKEIKPLSLPAMQQMPKPPDARIIPLERQTPLTHAQVEQVRFGLGDTGPLAQAVMNANVPAVMKQLTIGAVSCLSTRKPADPVAGQMIWETDTQQVRFWNGTAWVTPANATPSGTISAFGGVSLPTGYLWCDGTQKLIASYPALFAALGVSRYGVDTATQFYLPNLTSHLPRGAATTGGAVVTNANNTPTITLNATGVAVSTDNNATSLAHNHSTNASTANVTTTPNGVSLLGNTSSRPAVNHTHPVNGASTSSDGGALAHGHPNTVNVTQPTVVGTAYVPAFVEVNYIIKT